MIDPLHIVNIDGDVQSELVTLSFKQGENLKILQKERNIYGETVSPKRLILQYIKSLSNSDKLK